METQVDVLLKLYGEELHRFIVAFFKQANSLPVMSTAAAFEINSAKAIEAQAMDAAMRAAFENIPRLSKLLEANATARPVEAASGIYPLYADVIRAAERRVETAVREFLHRSVAAMVAAKILSTFHGQSALIINALPNTKAAIAALITPAPRTLEGWGSSGKKGAPTLDSGDSEHDTQSVMLALATDVARLTDSTVPKAHASETVVHALTEQLVAASAAASSAAELALRSDLTSVTHAVVEISVNERYNIVPQFERELLDTWDAIVDDYDRLLNTPAINLATLKTNLGSEAGERLRYSSDVCESYRAAAPLLPDSVPSAPKKRNLSVLLATQAGEQLIGWYTVFRPLVANKALRLPFVTEIPPYSYPALAAPFAVLADPMDRIHAELSRRAAVNTLLGTNPAMDALYNAIKPRP